ncbi:MAG: tripartite tricarboxylate transporter substrate-binding protein, partial [Betaproteobacteria bacterium]|nr:tripartite tricarboxylate transporter substrate-binding protein [Betaproteobacteria bacterium]
KLKPLGVSSEKRAPAVPDVPTLMEAGLKDFTYYAWYGMFAPDGTPKAAIQKIHGELLKISQVPEHRKKLEEQGLEAWTGTSEEFNKFVISETARWKQVVTEAKIPKLK